MSILASTFRWLQRKRYQYEVTFSLYMLTPTEKFIFNSFIFLFFSMILIAASLYLPQHLAFLTNRAWFYYHGDDTVKATVNTAAATALGSGAQAGRRMREAVESVKVQGAAKVAGTASSALGAGMKAEL